MAKDKKKKAKLPKDVFGIRLPKEWREAGGALLEKANTPAGREMMAAGLTMAAAAASAAVAKGRADRAATKAAPSPAAGDGGADAGAAASAAGAQTGAERPRHEAPKGTHTSPDVQAIAEVIGTQAEAVLGKLFGPRKV